MSDVFGEIAHLRRVRDALRWLKEWAQRQVSQGHEGLQTYKKSELARCPWYSGTLYATEVINPQMVRRISEEEFEINVTLLSKVELS